MAASRDLTAGVSLLAACLVARVTWPMAMASLGAGSEWTLAVASDHDGAQEQLTQFVTMWQRVAMKGLLPALGAAMVTGLLTSMAQTRGMFSLKPLSPSLDKLSPVNGFKRLFSVRGVVEAAKGLLKVMVILGAAAWALWARHEDITRLSDCSTLDAASLTTDLCFYVIIRIATLLFVIGVADYAYQYWEFERSLRMSRDELIQEYKRMEGDPQLRARRRAIRKNLLQQGISGEIKDATVVVVNPTHIAVALAYKPGMAAPRVVAKGRHIMAQHIVRIARRNGTPIIQDVQLARALYKMTAVGDMVPGELYQAVAEVLALIYRRAMARRLGR